MKSATRFYQILQALSLDVVAGSVAVGAFATRLLAVNPQTVWWIVLPLAVWSFYTLDHLIDGFKSKGETGIYRHRFHYKNRKTLVVLMLISGTAATLLGVLFLDKYIVAAGFGTGLLAAAYFSVLYFGGRARRLLLPKEFVIALVYVTGIWLAPLVWYGQLPDTGVLLVMLILFLLAWAEGIMASWFDCEKDTKAGHGSFTVRFGLKSTKHFLFGLYVFVFFMLGYLAFALTGKLQFVALLILALMNLVLLFTISFPSWFAKNDRYRIAGEAVFLLPALVAFF